MRVCGSACWSLRDGRGQEVFGVPFGQYGTKCSCTNVRNSAVGFISHSCTQYSNCMGASQSSSCIWCARRTQAPTCTMLHKAPQRRLQRMKDNEEFRSLALREMLDCFDPAFDPNWSIEGDKLPGVCQREPGMIATSSAVRCQQSKGVKRSEHDHSAIDCQ